MQDVSNSRDNSRDNSREWAWEGIRPVLGTDGRG